MDNLQERRRLVVVILGRRQYYQKVKNLFGSSLIGYWPLDETSGLIATDNSGNGFNGAYNNKVVLAQAGIGDGKTAAAFDGTAVCNIYSAGYAGAFNRDEGTLSLWFKISDPTVWSDGQLRVAFEVKTDDNLNGIHIAKNTPNNQIQVAYIGNNVSRTVQYDLGDTNWHHSLLTWSKAANQFCAYLDGVPDASNPQTRNNWTASALKTSLQCIGAYDSSPIETLAFKGLIAHAAIGNSPLTAAQALSLSKFS